VTLVLSTPEFVTGLFSVLHIYHLQRVTSSFSLRFDVILHVKLSPNLITCWQFDLRLDLRPKFVLS